MFLREVLAIKSWVLFRLICCLHFYLLVNRLIVFFVTLLTLSDMMDKTCLVPSLKVHTHTHSPTAPFCLHSRYLFLWWIVSEAERLHGDGSPQISIRKREGKRRLKKKATIPPYLPLLYTCWHLYSIHWYGFTRRLIHSLHPPSSPSAT